MFCLFRFDNVIFFFLKKKDALELNFFLSLLFSNSLSYLYNTGR